MTVQASAEAVDVRDQALLRAALLRMRLIAPGETPRCEPLLGGVSSNIWKVETGAQAGVQVLAISVANKAEAEDFFRHWVLR